MQHQLLLTRRALSGCRKALISPSGAYICLIRPGTQIQGASQSSQILDFVHHPSPSFPFLRLAWNDGEQTSQLIVTDLLLKMNLIRLGLIRSLQHFAARFFQPQEGKHSR